MKRYIEFIDDTKTSAVEQLNNFLENLSKGSIYKVAGYQANTDCSYILLEVENELVNQLDEPQPVKVPQFVADWYEEHKDEFEYNVWDWLSSKSELGKIDSEFAFWLNDVDNTPIQTLVNMHQFGYEVEEEKRYLVKMLKADFNGKIQILSFRNNSFFWSSNWESYKVHHARKELEDAGFGWVFDCEGIEIEEVE